MSVPAYILIREVAGAQYFAVLSSADAGQPYTNLVSFAVTDNLKSLVFVTARHTRKYRNIQENPQVSLLIDNRANRPADISRAVAITVIGTAREEIVDRDRLQAVFLARHPHLRQFAGNPDNALILVDVSEYIVAGFTRTRRVVIP